MAMCKDFVRFSQGIIGLFRGFGIRLGRRCFFSEWCLWANALGRLRRLRPHGCCVLRFCILSLSYLCQ